MGNTPEHYASHKSEVDFNELIDFVEKRKAMPTDSGRSSSMSMSRGSTGNLAGKAKIDQTSLMIKYLLLLFS